MLPGTLGIFLPIIIPLCMCLPMLIKWHRLNGGVVVFTYINACLWRRLMLMTTLGWHSEYVTILPWYMMLG